MTGQRRVDSVSIYFFAGDFADVLRRYDEGREQVYGTHNEVARLVHDLHDAGIRVTLFSFVTPEASDRVAMDGVRIVSLGARDYSDDARLATALGQDDAEATIAHFPNPFLLRQAARADRPAAAFLASSFNKSSLVARLKRRRLVALLNQPGLDLVCNHCFPATDQLATFGVDSEKLLAWDVPHRFDPASYAPKTLPSRDRYDLAYAGSISEAKGVGDLIRAVARLRGEGMNVHCSLAGLGDVEAMRALARELGVVDFVGFRGQVSNHDVFELFRAADLVAVPSRPEFEEGFPLVMFEAIASRTPIVCSDHPMFRPVMLDGARAFTFRAGEVASIAAAVRQALADPSVYAALSSAASASWAALSGAADWRTLVRTWVVEGARSPWIAEARRRQFDHQRTSA